MRKQWHVLLQNIRHTAKIAEEKKMKAGVEEVLLSGEDNEQFMENFKYT